MKGNKSGSRDIRTYRSKFGYGVLLMLTVVFGAVIAYMIHKNEPVRVLLLVGGIFSAVYGLCLYLMLTTVYSITNTGILRVRCGFITYNQVEIASIKSITNTKSLISAPAPSFDRIEVAYGKYGTLVISPKDKYMFANALKEINPDINIQLDK